jgi:hypothetical protein
MRTHVLVFMVTLKWVHNGGREGQHGNTLPLRFPGSREIRASVPESKHAMGIYIDLMGETNFLRYKCHWELEFISIMV